jgi:hypothetical protein
MVKRAAWLSITPEPERLLPRAAATLRHGSCAPDDLVATERARIERVLLHGRQRQWLEYLHGVVELIDRGAVSDDPSVRDARELAAVVIANHHNLLLGLPGRAARLTATDRAHLASCVGKSTGIATPTQNAGPRHPSN